MSDFDRRESLHHAKSARQYLKLMRSNLREGFIGHAMMYLSKASFEAGAAWIHDTKCADRSRGVRASNTLEHARRRVLNAAGIP